MVPQVQTFQMPDVTGYGGKAMPPRGARAGHPRLCLTAKSRVACSMSSPRRSRFLLADADSLQSATRAAIVIPAVFAVADKVIAQPQTSIMAAFGSFAMLVLVEFGGPTRTRLAAYAGLGLVGAVFTTLGTLCSRDPLLAVAAMAAVGFVILFAGAFGSYLAAGLTAAMLTFVLPVTIAAPNSTIPARLEGWALAVVAGIGAAMLLWPTRQSAELRRDIAVALRAIAAFAESDREGSSEEAQAARQAVDGLQRRFLGSQHRPTAGAAATAALASLPDELDWLLSFLAPSSANPPKLKIACSEDEEALAAIAAVLRLSADRLEGGGHRPDLARLDAAREGVARAVMRRLPELLSSFDEDTLMAALDAPFRIRAASYSARQIAGYALLATGAKPPELNERDLARPPAGHPGLVTTVQTAVAHVGSGSVWFQNSVRGAVGLAMAVFIAQEAGLQHGFWVVLGTLSVLRSNALSTGRSVVSALAGTSIGIVVGALLVIAIGTHAAVLWALLPPAILLAAYAPRAISFAAGQAAFTVLVVILFNIIQPVGWTVGIVRIEDVAIGFAISLGVGLLFWPRGATARLRRDLAAAYAGAADFVMAAARQLTEEGAADAATQAAQEAETGIHRLDDAFRQYLTERSATSVKVEDIAVLVGGATRVRRSALSLAALAAMVDAPAKLDSCARHLDHELQAVHAWYVTLGHSLIHHQPIPPQHIRDREGHAKLLGCILDATRTRQPETLNAAVVVLWASQYLDHLWRLEGHLAAHTLVAEPPRRGLPTSLRALAS